jgi:hypothetical protein
MLPVPERTLKGGGVFLKARLENTNSFIVVGFLQDGSGYFQVFAV